MEDSGSPPRCPELDEGADRRKGLLDSPLPVVLKSVPRTTGLNLRKTRSHIGESCSRCPLAISSPIYLLSCPVVGAVCRQLLGCKSVHSVHGRQGGWREVAWVCREGFMLTQLQLPPCVCVQW